MLNVQFFNGCDAFLQNVLGKGIAIVNINIKFTPSPIVEGKGMFIFYCFRIYVAGSFISLVGILLGVLLLQI